MPNENEPEASTEETVETPPEGTETDDKTEGQTEPTLSHEDALSALTATRAEAANTRVKLRDTQKLLEDLEAKLADAKSPEDIEAATAELVKQNAELQHQILVRDIAAEHKLPADLADALKGSTKEELEAHAKVLAKYAPVDSEAPPEKLGGGLRPGDGPDPLAGKNPRELAALARKRRG